MDSLTALRADLWPIYIEVNVVGSRGVEGKSAPLMDLSKNNNNENNKIKTNVIGATCLNSSSNKNPRADTLGGVCSFIISQNFIAPYQVQMDPKVLQAFTHAPTHAHTFTH